MSETKVHPDFLPMHLAFEYNFQPAPGTKSENWDIGGEEYMILLANTTFRTNVLFIFDHDYDT